MAFKGINNIAPRYLCEKLNLVKQRHSRNTRSSAQNTLSVPPKFNNFAKRTFINSFIKTTFDWNNMPIHLKYFCLYRNF